MATDTYKQGATAWISLKDGSSVTYPTAGGGGSNPTWNNNDGPMFGFQMKNDYVAGANQWYNPAGESASAINTRLTGAFGNTYMGKEFQVGGFPSNWSSLYINSYSSSIIVDVMCTTWTPGSIASGSMDSKLSTLFNSVPSGKTLIMSRNEVDAELSGSSKTSYIADMDYMHDYIAAHTYTGTVWVGDCLQGSQVIAGTTTLASWIPHPAKRDVVVLDCYQNQYGSSASSGNSKFQTMADAAGAIGLPWILGETGDRRPGTNKSTTPSDAARATRWNIWLDYLVGLNPQPLGCLWFDVVGSTGDHRILQSTMSDQGSTAGPDTNMITMYAARTATSRGGV